MSDDMQTKTAGRASRKVNLSPELTEVLNMLKALERTTAATASSKPA
jgi:hypothetical protein